MTGKKIAVSALLPLLGAAVLLMSCGHKKPMPAQPRVLILGVDGITPRGLKLVSTPVIDSLKAAGSSTFTATSVLPSLSHPNWASILMGAPPELHGVTDNEWKPETDSTPPPCTGIGEIFPTIFSQVKSELPEAKTGIFHELYAFRRWVEPNALDRIARFEEPETGIGQFLEWRHQHDPVLSMLYLHFTDKKGHVYGFDSEEYLAGLQKMDSLVGMVMTDLHRTGMQDSTLVIFISDHGGIGTGHGGDSPEEIEVPFILSGPGIRKNHQIKSETRVFDLPAYICRYLGIPTHPCWTAKADKSIFLP